MRKCFRFYYIFYSLQLLNCNLLREKNCDLTTDKGMRENLMNIKFGKKYFIMPNNATCWWCFEHFVSNVHCESSKSSFSIVEFPYKYFAFYCVFWVKMPVSNISWLMTKIKMNLSLFSISIYEMESS